MECRLQQKINKVLFRLEINPALFGLKISLHVFRVQIRSRNKAYFESKGDFIFC